MISFKLNNPNKDGLTSSEESEMLFKIEEDILNNFNKANTIFIGRITTNGYRIFYFYSKNTESFLNEKKCRIGFKITLLIYPQHMMNIGMAI
ncbi:DUF695 domain-containing protein [Chryseobacterium sp.]|uniref:DUF695 domain-containing protein n=1 Tax=Chryseobacterium sp. TaxID=1871047 RepID=UPI00388F10BA